MSNTDEPAIAEAEQEKLTLLEEILKLKAEIDATDNGLACLMIQNRDINPRLQALGRIVFMEYLENLKGTVNEF